MNEIKHIYGVSKGHKAYFIRYEVLLSIDGDIGFFKSYLGESNNTELRVQNGDKTSSTQTL